MLLCPPSSAPTTRSVTARFCPLSSQGGHGATASPLSPAQPGAAGRTPRKGRAGRSHPAPPSPPHAGPRPTSTPGGENPQEASPPRRAAPHPGTRARAARAARGSASSSCRSFPASARFQGARRSRRCSAARPGWEHAPRRHSSAPTAARQPHRPCPQGLGQGWDRARGKAQRLEPADSARSGGCAGAAVGDAPGGCSRAGGRLREGRASSRTSRRAEIARGEAPVKSS